MITRSLRSLALAAALAAGFPRVAPCQALSTPLLPISPRIAAPVRSPFALDRLSQEASSTRPSYWWQGGLIGSAVMVGAAVWLGTLCNGDSGTDCGSYRRTIIFAAIPVGFITGALIGGNLHPHRAEPPPSQ